MAEVPLSASLADQAARDRIASDLDSTLFVDAGAGSGKTHALVERVVALVISGMPMSGIAAITFTEKAAAELRDRVRGELEKSVSGASLSAEDRRRCRDALDDLDAAAVGTLHSFAQRLLVEHPVEAGLPPRIEVLDEVESGVRFDERWSAFLDELLADASLERTLHLLVAAGVRPAALRHLASAFDKSWDLVAERVPEHAPEPPPVAAMATDALDAIETVCDLRHGAGDGDLLVEKLEGVFEHICALRRIEDDLDLLEALADEQPYKIGTAGAQRNWDGISPKEVRDLLREAVGELDEARRAVLTACAERLGVAIRAFTLAAADERRAAGELEFHDLLVLARALLRHPEHGPAARESLRQRYQRLLLDEFQDTDPIQIDLAVLLASATQGAGDQRWDEIDTDEGRLFFVGDPKQSIYRFRRADIALFLAARRRFGGDGLVELTTNFRTAAPIIEWLNTTFGTLITATDEEELPIPSQPDYLPLGAVRAAASVGPPVAVVGAEEHEPGCGADQLREREAHTIAATIRQVLDERWHVDSADDWQAPSWREATLGDIAILVPARTSLPFLEDALDEAGVPYRAEASSLVYASRLIRDLFTLLRAVDDPTDRLSVVAALRSPLLGCGDDDLFRFKVERAGHWGYLGQQPPTVPADDPVRRGLGVLAELHAARRWSSPSELLEHVVRERRVMELGAAEGRPRDLWRRVRFVVDAARAWSDATNGSLRSYLHWVAQQTAEGARVAEAVLPETDDDAVRIMTVHAAKGLEFPITIVSGMSTRPQSRPSPADVVFPPDGTVGYRFGAAVKTHEFNRFAPIDEQLAFDERVRLLYVACSRARDHLVVSLHRAAPKGEPKPLPRRTHAELLVEGMGSLLDQLPEVGVDSGEHPPVPAVDVPPLDDDLASWRATRDAALEEQSRPRTIAATALAADGAPDTDDDDGLAKRPRDLDLPPWLKGRYGSSLGRAVHGVLQTVDLATGEGVDAAVAAQAAAEGLIGREKVIAAHVRAALGSDLVRAASAAPHWREVYVGVPILGDDGEIQVVEGYIDLLYRSDDGLVVVDYKTGAADSDDQLTARVAGYRAQGAAYALAVADATGEPVVRCTFLFVTAEQAVPRDLPDLDGAVADVRASVTRAGAQV